MGIRRNCSVCPSHYIDRGGENTGAYTWPAISIHCSPVYVEGLQLREKKNESTSSYTHDNYGKSELQISVVDCSSQSSQKCHQQNITRSVVGTLNIILVLFHFKQGRGGKQHNLFSRRHTSHHQGGRWKRNRQHETNWWAESFFLLSDSNASTRWF